MSKSSNRQPQPLVNEKILKIRDIMVIGPDGEQIGVMQSRKALDYAKNLGLDLFLVSPKSNPPVCKVLDYGKFKYLEDKKTKLHKKTELDLKEVKISPNIALNDLMTMFNRTSEFLQKGHKVKLTCVFKYRELDHPNLGYDKINKMIELLGDSIVCDTGMVLFGKNLTITLSSKK